MGTSYKPPGYNSLSPYLIVDGAARTLDFLERAFGAKRLRRFDDPSGRVLHAEAQIDDTVVMLSDGAPGSSPIASHVHLYVPDVDATYKRALEAGGTSVQAPVRKDDPDKRGGVKDAGGTTWWISTQTGGAAREALALQEVAAMTSPFQDP